MKKTKTYKKIQTTAGDVGEMQSREWNTPQSDAVWKWCIS